jgi:hypothetical protein
MGAIASRRVTKIVDPTTVKIKHSGKTQTVDLIGVRVPKTGTVHKRALQTTKSQLDYSVVTVVTDPKIANGSDGHLQVCLYRQLAVQHSVTPDGICTSSGRRV